MFLRPHQRSKDGKDHTYWSLVETVRRPSGPRQRTLCYLGELNSSAQARWLKTVEVFNEQGETEQLKLFPSHIEPPANDPQVVRVLVNRVRLERTRQFGTCFLGWELWKRLELDGFFQQAMDNDRRRCRGRAWPRCWPLIGCARRAASWRSKSAGILRPRSRTCWTSTKTRSTTRVCIAAWTGCCRIKRNWNSISSSVMASYSGPSLMCCCTTSRARMWKERRKRIP